MHDYKDAEGRVTHGAVTEEVTEGPGGALVHVFLSASETSELNRLVEAAATLVVVDTATERAALD